MDNFKKVVIVIVIAVIVIYALLTGDPSNAKKEAYKKAKIKEFDLTHEVNKINTYSVKSVNHEEMAKLYFNDYKNLILNYQDEAYELIINKVKFTKDDFLEYRNNLINNFYGYQYKSYSYYQESSTGSYVYRVINNKGETFTFKTYSVMNYEVNITLY